MPVTVVIRYLHDLYESHLQTERFSVSLPPWQKEANYIREINTMDNMIFIVDRELSTAQKICTSQSFGNTNNRFFNPHAVKALNKALLISYYGIRYWDIPRNYLCPPIPGRADYVHYIADLIDLERVSNTANEENGDKPKRQCRCLDIGVGANCIYPIIGHVEYGWMFVGSDIDPVSIENARKIVTCNPVLAHKIDLRLQKDNRRILTESSLPMNILM